MKSQSKSNRIICLDRVISFHLELNEKNRGPNLEAFLQLQSCEKKITTFLEMLYVSRDLVLDVVVVVVDTDIVVIVVDVAVIVVIVVAVAVIVVVVIVVVVVAVILFMLFMLQYAAAPACYLETFVT